MIESLSIMMMDIPRQLEPIMPEEFFYFVLPWLLTFAVFYGILTQIELIDNKGAMTIISIGFSFVVAAGAAPVVPAVIEISTGFVALLTGFLVMMVFLEVSGLGAKMSGGEEGNFFLHHPLVLIVILGLLSFIIFTGAGGFEALGLDIMDQMAGNYPTIFFLVVVVLVIGWMVSEGGENGNGN